MCHAPRWMMFHYCCDLLAYEVIHFPMCLVPNRLFNELQMLKWKSIFSYIDVVLQPQNSKSGI